MAIQTPTDLILDVVRAADPAVAKKTEAMLEAASARRAEYAANTPAFKQQLLASSDPSQLSLTEPNVPKVDETAETYKKFEAMVLQKFIGSMLPQDSEELYGKGTAGEVWRGMMAEQLGKVLAEGGGIGIAARMLADRIAPVVAPESADAFGSNITNRAANLVNEVQMQILSGISHSDSDASGLFNEPGNSASRRA